MKTRNTIITAILLSAVLLGSLLQAVCILFYVL